MSEIRGLHQRTLVGGPDNTPKNVALDGLGGMYLGDIKGLAARAAAAGRLVVASDADQNDRVTAQTSFANTTPTFLLNVPDGSCAVPLWVDLAQKGSVAGDFIEVKIEADDIAAYSSGGTSETLFYLRNGAGFTSSCALYSGATTTAGYGISLAQYSVAEDVDPASADAQPFKVRWDAGYVLPLIGPASFKVFTWAGSTAPTWEWSIGFLDLPVSMFA